MPTHPGHTLAHPDFPHDYWTLADADAADAEGWNIFDRGGRLEIERNDVCDVETAPWFEYDEDAQDHVVSCARRGSDLHERALTIHLKYADWWEHTISLALWATFAASRPN